MASLFIKDSTVAERVTRVADRLGTTKTDTVRQALDALEDRIGAEPAREERSVSQRLAEWRKANPLPPPTGPKADKAFFDRLWGEED